MFIYMRVSNRLRLLMMAPPGSLTTTTPVPTAKTLATLLPTSPARGCWRPPVAAPTSASAERDDYTSVSVVGMTSFCKGLLTQIRGLHPAVVPRCPPPPKNRLVGWGLQLLLIHAPSVHTHRLAGRRVPALRRSQYPPLSTSWGRPTPCSRGATAAGLGPGFATTCVDSYQGGVVTSYLVDHRL